MTAPIVDSAPSVSRVSPANGGPIFIGGLYKSGTTLLRAMLGQHRDIHSGLETQWVDLTWPVDQANAVQARHLERLRRFFDLSAMEMQRMLRVSNSTESFIANFMTSAASAAGKARWCEKTPQNILHADRILAAFADSVLIHVVRDPRDILASIYEAGRHDWVEAFAGMWCDFVGMNERRFAEGRFERSRFLRVRYEDLVLKTEATMRGLLAGIGVEWDPAVAVFEGRDSDFAIVKSVVGKESTTLRRLQNPMEQGRIGLAARVLPDGLLAKIAGEVSGKGFGREFDRVILERAAVTGAWPGAGS